jgi:Tfp pilus assembly protein PilF
VALIAALALPWLVQRDVVASRRAAARGDGSAALSRALEARNLQPWATSPRLQLALVSEQTGDRRAARRWIASAIRRDGRDWQLWLTAARIDTEVGDIPAAERAYARARALNPRGPIFSSAPPG